MFQTYLLSNVNQDELLNILKYKSAEYTGVLPLLAGVVFRKRRQKLSCSIKRIWTMPRLGLSDPR